MYWLESTLIYIHSFFLISEWQALSDIQERSSDIQELTKLTGLDGSKEKEEGVVEGNHTFITAMHLNIWY